MDRPVAELFGSHEFYGMVGDGINTATGNFTVTEVDLAFGSRLLSLQRTYNSLDETAGPLGRGWTIGLGDQLTPAGEDDEPIMFRAGDGRVLPMVPDGAGLYRSPDLDAALTRTANNTFSLRYRSGVTSAFDAAGRLTSRSDEGERLDLRYESGRLARVIHSTGLELAFSYDTEGRLSNVRASDDRTVTYRYRADGLLTSVQRAGDDVVTYEMADGRLTRIVDADGRVTMANAYDDEGRVRHQDIAEGGGVDVTYNLAEGTTAVTATAEDVTVTYRHDRGGRLTQLSGPGLVSTRTFDDHGRLASVTTPGNGALSFTYDGRGNLTSYRRGEATTSFAYDDRNRVVSQTDPTGAVTTYAYVGDGRVPVEVKGPDGTTTRNTIVAGLVTQTTDATGAKVSFGYDTQRHLVRVTDALGRVTNYRRDHAGRVLEVTTPTGAKSAFSYDGAGRLATQTDPEGNVTRHRYSRAGLLLETTDATGAVTRYAHDAAGRLASTADPLGRTTTYSHDGQGNIETMTGPGGAVTRYERDALGQLARLTDPAGTPMGFRYDADGRETERTAPSGTTVTAYDRQGNVTATTDATGAVSSYEYDPVGREVAATDPVGGVWRTVYDPAGRVIARTDPTGATTRYEYDAAGRLSSVTDALGHLTRYLYDAAGQLVTVVDPMGGETRYVYDADGRRISETTPAGLTTTSGYDRSGRVTSLTNPRGGVTRYEYSPRGELTRSVTPGGAVRVLRYDAAGQMVESTDPNGFSTKYEYDTPGNLVAITDARQHVHRFGYDQARRQTSSTDPLGRVTNQRYDERGNLVAVTEPSGQTLRMEYDAADRVTRRTGADGATVSFSYDAAGRRTAMTDAAGTTRYVHDPMGRPLRVTQPDGSVLLAAYDPVGSRVALRYPDGTEVAYRYDANDRLIGLTDPRAGDVSYMLDADGRLLGEDLPGPWRRDYAYDRGRLVRYQEKTFGPHTQTELTYDADDRVLRETSTGRDSEFRYDPAGQLVSTTGQTGDRVTVAYDAVGNRTSLSQGGSQTTYTYDAADQLVAIDTGQHHQDLNYDSAGRLTRRTGHGDELSIEYNSFGMPSTISEVHGGVTRKTEASYTGDRLLRGVKTTRQAGPKPAVEMAAATYLWDPAAAVPQIVRQDGDAAANFVYGYGRVFADTTDHSAPFSRDVDGSTVRTPDTRAWADADRYDAFGNADPTDFPGPLPRFGYRGELSIGSLTYLRARNYDASTGRFLSRDPISTLVGQVDTVSLYAYANNDPVNASDPTGRWAISDLFFDLIPALSSLYAPGGCPDPNSSIERHAKCFQGRQLFTRGYIEKACLDAERFCLNKLWHSAQPERAAHAFTLNELNRKRQGTISRFFDERGWGTDLDKNVDWEVGPHGDPMWNWRIDIVVNELDIYEVKRWGPVAAALAEAQLGSYIAEAAMSRWILFRRGAELQNWANFFEIYDSWDDYAFGPDRVYVWGYKNPPGHIYFAKDDKVPPVVRAKGKEMENTEQGKVEPGVGLPIGLRRVVRV
jgi:RHS repeat-associated protein